MEGNCKTAKSQLRLDGLRNGKQKYFKIQNVSKFCFLYNPLELLVLKSLLKIIKKQKTKKNKIK